MQIHDLAYLNPVAKSNSLTGAAFASSSSTSIAGNGFTLSTFEAMAIGKSGSGTIARIGARTFVLPQYKFSFASAQMIAYAQD
jgi:hypothetical protein